MMHKNIVIYGATSAMAQAVAKKLANINHHFYLIARNQAHLATIASDLAITSQAQVDYAACDLTNFNELPTLQQNIINTLGKVDMVFIAHGILPNQEKCQQNDAYCQDMLTVNLLSPIAILSGWANYFETNQAGTLAVISSVAGDRGRQSNYVYGTAKAGLNTFLQGLRQRLHKVNVRVLTIKPGFVDTPMTKDFNKGLLWVKPEKVASAIVKALKHQSKYEVYVPGFWRYIMLVIKYLPERVFCKLKL